MSRNNSINNSRNNSRNNSIDISVSKSRTSSWDYRRSDSFGSIETIDLEVNHRSSSNKEEQFKSNTMKIAIVDSEKKRTRDVYIDIENPCKVPTPTPVSFLEKYMASDLVWLKSKTKSKTKYK